MASVEAAINLVVRGSGAVNRLIQDINRLEGLVESLSRSPIDITFGNADREIQRLGRAVEGTEGEIRGLQNSLNPLRQAYERTAQGAARFERANNVFNRSLEVSRRAVSLYQANIESLNRTAYGQPQRSEKISTLNTAFREGLVTQRDYARLMLRTRQEFANLYAAEAALERAQERQNSLTLEAARNTGSLFRARATMAAQAQDIARGEQRIEMVRGRMATQQNLLQGAEGFRNQIDFLNRLASSYTSVEAAAARASGNLENIPRDMSRGGVRQEISVFDDLANSVNYTSDAFGRFTIASQAANLTLGQIQRQRLRVLTEAFSPSFAAGAQPLDSPRRGEGAVDVSNTRAAVNRLLLESQPSEQAGATVQRGLVRSEAGLTLMIDQLQQLRALIPFVDADYGRLTERITELNEEMNRGMGRTRPESIQRPLGLAVRLGGAEQFREQQRYEKAVTEELSKQVGIEERIANARLTSSQRTELHNRVLEASNLLADDQLEASRDISREIDRTRHSYERLNRDRDKGLKFINTVERKVSDFFASANRLEQISPDMFDSSDLDAFVNRIKTVESLYSGLNKQNKKNLEDWDKKLKAADQLRDKLAKISSLYAQGRGGPALPPGGGPGVSSPLTSTRRVQSQIASAEILSERLNQLEIQGVDVTRQRADAQKIINSLRSKDLEISDIKLLRYDEELVRLRAFVGLEKERISTARTAEKLTGRGIDRAAALADRWRQKGGPLAAPVDRIAGATSPINAREIAASQLRVGEQILENLVTLEKQRVNISEQRASIDSIVNNLRRQDLRLSEELLSSNASEFRSISDFVKLQNTKLSNTRLQGRLEEENRKLEEAWIRSRGPAVAPVDRIVGEVSPIDARTIAENTIKSAQIQLRKLTGLEIEGIDVASERARVEKIISDLSNDQVGLSEKALKNATQQLNLSRFFVQDGNLQLANARKLQRLTTGETVKKPRTPEQLEEQRNRQLQQAYGLRGQINDLDKKAVDVGDLRIQNERIITELKQKQGRVTADNAKLLQSEFAISGASLGALKTGIAGLKSELVEASKATGFGKSFQDFQEGLKGSRTFFGDESPAQAIDKIVRGFTGAATDPSNLLGLSAIGKAAKSSTKDLEILSTGLKDVYLNLDPTADGFERLNRELRQTTARLDEIVASRAPDADPLVRLTRSPRLAQGISEGLIGGAFPLLFGQGAGAAVGGGLGGFAGGFAGGALGFGLSLIGTAVGTAFDTTVQSAAELGGVLNDTAKAFDAVKERSLFSSKEVEKLAGKLEEAGFSSAASILSQQEVINKIGGSGVQRLRDLGESSDRLSRAWAEFNLQLQVALAGPMAGLLEWVAGIVAESNKVSRGRSEVEDVRNRLSGADREEFDKRIGEAELLYKLPGANPNRITREESLQKQIGIAREFAARASLAPPVELKLDTDTLKAELKTALEGISSVLSQELELLNIGKGFSDQFRNAIREQEDINEQAFEIRKGYEESIRDIRLGVERAVQKEALDGLRAQNELVKLQGEARLQQLRNANAELVSAQGADEYGRRLFEILGRAAELELSSQQNVENKKRDLELDLQAKAIETEIYKADIAKQVASLNESSAKSIANINKSIRRSNEDYDERKFGIEKEIASIRLQLMKMENQKAISDVQRLVDAYENLAPGRELNEFGRRVLESNKNYLKLLQSQESPLGKAQRAVADAQLPAKKAEVAPISTTGVSLAAFDAVRERAVAAAKAISEAQDELASLAKQGEWIQIKDQLIELADQGFAQAAKQLSVFVGRFKDISVSGFGDEFSAPLEELERRRLDLEALFETEQTEGSRTILEQYKKAGLDERQGAGLVELGIEVTKLSKNQLEGVRTAQYYLDSASDLTQEFDSLSDQLREATQFGTQYEKTLASLVGRGLDPATEASRALLAEAEKIDILRQKIAVVESFTFAADTLSGSMKDLVLQFVELGSASAAVKKVSDELGKKAFGFILDLAFKPVEENMRKSMLDMATKLGFDISTPQERQLKELESIRLSNDGILENLQKIVERYVGAAVAPTAPPAVSTVPSNSSRLLQTQSGLRTPEELALRDMTSYAEGTWQPKGVPGYDVKYGGGRFNTASHPGGSAAGAYQFMPGTWASLGGGAMNPATQDLRFFELVKNRGVDAKQMISPQMIDKLSPEWAAFPTMQGRSYHNQPFKPYQDLERFYKERLDFYRNVIPAGTSQQGPQSSLPSSMMYGIGGPDLPVSTQLKPGTVRPDLLEKYLQEIRTSFAPELANEKTLESLEAVINQLKATSSQNLRSFYGKQGYDVESVVTEVNAVFDDLYRRNVERIKSAAANSAAMPAPISQPATEIATPPATPITPAATETNKALTEAGSGITKIRESAAKDAQKLNNVIVPQWTKNLGMAVTGLSMATSAVVSIVGGIGSIKKGGAGNVLSGIGSILTTIGSIGMSVSGFMKPAAGNSALGVKTGFLANANGNIFDDGELMRFANGGVLQSPTLFNFEDAGVTKTGQAGEAGVEAVMPLKRTKDGRLGVEADLSIPFESDGQFEAEDDLPASLEGEGDFASDGGQRSANGSRSPMVPFLRAGGRTGSMTATQMLQAAAEAGLPVPFTKDSSVAAPDLASLDSPIRFETLRVGELDVVTREEAEEIGRRAEARGATKGAALAQKKMQNSPATRRRSGLPT